MLTYSSGDSMVGYFDGTYTDGMRFNGTIYKAISDHGPGPKQPPQQPESVSASVSQKIGLFSVGPALKWKPVFSMLGPTGRPSAAGDHTGPATYSILVCWQFSQSRISVKMLRYTNTQSRFV